MKLLFSLLPFQPPPPESQLSAAFISMVDEFLLQCMDLLSRLKSTTISGYYQPDYDSDEETIETGHERYEAMLRNSQVKVRSCFVNACISARCAALSLLRILLCLIAPLNRQGNLDELDLKDLVTQKLTYLCQSPDDVTCQALRKRMDPGLLSTLNKIIQS